MHDIGAHTAVGREFCDPGEVDPATRDGVQPVESKSLYICAFFSVRHVLLMVGRYDPV